MSDTGEKVCGAVDSAGSWQNFTTTRLNSSDNSRAQHDPPGSSDGIVYNFSFGIPANADIAGIEVIIEGVAAPGSRGIIVSLSWNGKTSWTATKTNTWTTTEIDKSYGGATDTWGRTWTVDEFADGTFYLKARPTADASDGIGIDYLRVKVYYVTDITVTPPALALNVTEAAPGLNYAAASPVLSFDVNENQSAMLFSSTPAALALNLTEAMPGAVHTLVMDDVLGLTAIFGAPATPYSATSNALSLNISEPAPVVTLTALANALGLDITELSPGVGLIVFPGSLNLALTIANAEGRIIYPVVIFAASRARDLAMTAEQRDTNLMADNRDTRLDAETRDTNLKATQRDTNIIAEHRNG